MSLLNRCYNPHSSNRNITTRSIRDRLVLSLAVRRSITVMRMRQPIEVAGHTAVQTVSMFSRPPHLGVMTLQLSLALLATSVIRNGLYIPRLIPRSRRTHRHNLVCIGLSQLHQLLHIGTLNFKRRNHQIQSFTKTGMELHHNTLIFLNPPFPTLPTFHFTNGLTVLHPRFRRRTLHVTAIRSFLDGLLTCHTVTGGLSLPLTLKCSILTLFQTPCSL